MDEEPPHNLNEEAIDTCLEASMMVDAKPVDEIHVMRKIVIDGSNTSGFQRTCIIALGGEIKVEGKTIGLQTMSLEEDAARKTDEKGDITTYRLDRLCIPLIEIATAPEIFTPDEAEKAAFALGRVLRTTRKVLRGKGTIRQDLNVSIIGGALTEIKGVQELEMVAPIVENEVQRQLRLLEIAQELKVRGVEESNLREEYVNVSETFKSTRCKVVGTALEKKGVAMAICLPNFAGLLGKELLHGLRLGTEISSYAKFAGRVGGVFHTDELPAYGITPEEVSEIKKLTEAKEEDAVIIIADEETAVRDALHAVIERAKMAIRGVPGETRAAQQDGTTRFSRPRPGAARMYPETDVPPVVIDQIRLDRIRNTLPLSPDLKLAQLMKEYNLNETLASQLLSSEFTELFEHIQQETHIPSSFSAATLVETMKSLRRQGLDVQNISDSTLFEVFVAVDSGKIAKEAIPDILSWLARNPEKTVLDGLKALGLETVSEGELEIAVAKAIEDNKEMIMERRTGALGPLMGILMKEFRGKVDAKVLSDMLRKHIEQT
jgi:glutamyl-tRNA(Gln) amidotransferase subunit E